MVKLHFTNEDCKVISNVDIGKSVCENIFCWVFVLNYTQNLNLQINLVIIF